MNDKRYFLPAHEWVYFKIYTGKTIAEQLLVFEIRELVRYFLEQKIIDQWFFIRYNDPDFHLRIRFHVPASQKVGNLINMVNDTLAIYITDYRIWNVQIDTYRRELERYDLSTYDKTEKIFFADSCLSLRILQQVYEQGNEQLRWLAGIKSIDDFLNIVFEQNTTDKLNFIKKMADGFADEFNMDKKLRKAINQKYKKFAGEIEAVINNQHLGIQFIKKELDNRNKHVENILTNETVDYITLSGLVHMMLNRLFKSANRKQELVMYQFLFLYYRSLQARNKYQNSRPTT